MSATVAEDPAGSGVTLPLNATEDLDNLLLYPPHLYSGTQDYGVLEGIREAILPANVEMTIQNKFYQFIRNEPGSVGRTDGFRSFPKENRASRCVRQSLPLGWVRIDL